MNAEQHVPQFRFKGFSDSWEQHKLSDGTNKIGDGLHGTPKYSEDGDVYFVNGNNLVNGQIVITSETKRVTSNEQSKDDKALNENTILMSINGTIGNLAWYRGENLMLGKSAAYIEVSDFDKKFIYTYLQTRPVKDYYLNSLTGTTIKNLGLKAIRNTNIYTPTIDEQAKIGVLFQNLDMTITLHQRKLAKLKELKKGYLQKLFPQNSEKVPEFRFKGYSDAWEKRKLGALLTERNVQHPQNSEYPLVSFTVEHGVTPKTERYEREQLVRGDKQAKKYKETRLNDIVYNPANLKFGAIARNSFGKAVFSPIYVTFEVNERTVLAQFMEMIVTRGIFIKEALRYQQGTVYERQSVNQHDLLSLNAMLPEKDEQMDIASTFSKLDNLIAATQRKGEVLKNLKKALLQKMFV